MAATNPTTTTPSPQNPTTPTTPPPPMNRIVIVGKSGVGKTTLSTTLTHHLSIPTIELDSLFWQPNWTHLATPEMRTAVANSTPPTGQWITDGNYTRYARDILWRRADTLIWLDYPLRIALWRVLKRTVKRVWRGEELWNGNKERTWNHVKGLVNGGWRDNLFVGCVRMHWNHRRNFPVWLAEEECLHLRVLRFRKPKDLEVWLRGLSVVEDGGDGENGGIKGNEAGGVGMEEIKKDGMNIKSVETNVKNDVAHIKESEPTKKSQP
ncbi:hypothetical protein BT63DRAFT_417877 [Microthyrium microscopicum]|uniref:P-loop containing nucleoside triphosphate hydrolase protein n=1 Tax=Microthyrium microscopicum TaxID=703497 RepID=A0A6A6U071_9PEZI|nr:hypothetical protein BT63DRAFT_417877 [Microthyrium microscopicum]